MKVVKGNLTEMILKGTRLKKDHLSDILCDFAQIVIYFDQVERNCVTRSNV